MGERDNSLKNKQNVSFTFKEFTSLEERQNVYTPGVLFFRDLSHYFSSRKEFHSVNNRKKIQQKGMLAIHADNNISVHKAGFPLEDDLR